MADFLIVAIPAALVTLAASFFIPQLVTGLGLSGTMANVIAAIIAGAVTAGLSMLFATIL